MIFINFRVTTIIWKLDIII